MHLIFKIDLNTAALYLKITNAVVHVQLQLK